MVITHDDRYFDVADQLVKLDFGRLQQSRPLSHGAILSEAAG